MSEAAIKLDPASESSRAAAPDLPAAPAVPAAPAPASAPAAPKAPREDPALTVELIEGRDAFLGLEKEWNAALARGPRDEPMLRHEWTRAWIENFAPSSPLRVFVARTGKEIQAAIALVESQERSADTLFLPMTTWALPVNDQSQRGGVLLGRRGEEGLRAIWNRLTQTEGWDRLRLRELPDGALDWSLREWAEQAGYPCGLWISLRSPYLMLPAAPPLPAKPEGGGGGGGKKKGGAPKGAAMPSAELSPRYELIEAAVDAKFRQNLRRRKRRLAEQGEVKYVLLDGKDQKALDEGLADFFTIESSGWKGKGGTATAIAMKPELVGFYTQIARDAAKRGALALGFLELAGKRIAAHLSMVQAGRHFLLKLGYDEALHEFSPGQQLVSEAIHDSCRRGLTEFDFLGPSMDWKLDWESALRTHSWLTIFRPTRKGLLVHEARFVAWPVARALIAQVKEKVAQLRAGKQRPPPPEQKKAAPAAAETKTAAALEEKQHAPLEPKN